MATCGRAWRAAAALLVLGCTPPAEPDPDAIAGSLLAHTDHVAAGARAFLGDGSRFTATVDANGDVRFDDPAIQGPQDLTIVDGSSGTPTIRTYLQVTKRELWIDMDSPPEDHSGDVEHALSGRVLGFDAGAQVQVRAYGSRDGDVAVADATGAWVLSVRGPASDTVDLVALQTAGGALTGLGVVAGVGVAGQPVVRDVRITDRIDARLTVDVTDLPSRSEVSDVEAHYVLRDFIPVIEQRDGTGTLPAVFPSPTMTDGLASLVRRVHVEAVRTPHGDSMVAVAAACQTVPREAASATVSLAPGARLVVPALSDEAPYPGVAAAEFRAQWVFEGATRVVVLELSGPALRWSVVAPASGQFEFRLPAGFAPFTAPPPERYGMSLIAASSSRWPDYADFYRPGALDWLEQCRSAYRWSRRHGRFALLP